MSEQPPHDNDLEWVLVSNVMDDPSRLGEVETHVKASDFYNDQSRAIYRAIVAVAGRGDAPDTTAVQHELRASEQAARFGGLARMQAFIDQTPYTAQLSKAAKRVASMSQMRSIIAAAQRIAAKGYSADALADIDAYRNEASQRMYEAVECVGTETYVRASDEVDRFLAEAEAGDASAAVAGLATGFIDLDKLISLRLGSVNVFAARPGMGKTALMLAMIANLIGADPKSFGEAEPTACALFTLEMSTREVSLRIISAGAQVGLSRLMRGTHDNAMLGRAKVGDYRKSLPQFFLDSRVSTIPELRIRVRQMRADSARLGHILRVVAVDYLQLMRGIDPRQREQEVAAISRGLKSMALEENLAVIALSQLNRGVEQRQEPKPKLSDLRESGAIEQDADTVTFLYSADYYNRDKPDYVPSGVVHLDVAKNRHGPCGDVEVGFEGEHTRFYNLAPRHAYHTEQWNNKPRTNTVEWGT